MMRTEGIIYTRGSSESNNLVLKGLTETYPEKKKSQLSEGVILLALFQSKPAFADFLE